MSEDEVLQRLDRESSRRTQAVRNLLLEKGRPDLVRDLDKQLRDVRLGVNGARGTWAALSEAQRRVLQIMGEGRRLVRVSRTRYDAYGEPHALVNVCGLPTVHNLCARELCHVDGGALDPEKRIVITERGRFILKHGPNP